MRNAYRGKFKLTAAEMDEEPLIEVNMHFAIWRLEAKRRRDDERAQNRKAATKAS